MKQYGELNGKAILTNTQVQEIRELLAQRRTQKYIANKYNISRTLVSHIKTGKRWSHLPVRNAVNSAVNDINT